jgi:dTDP-4-dehydrorhamnose reductase
MKVLILGGSGMLGHKLIKRLYRLDFQNLKDKRLRQATGFVPPPWNEMIEQMHTDPLEVHGT